MEDYRIFGWYTNLDDNGSDGFVRAEVGVGAAGILLGELAHDLHRLVVGGVRSCGCPHQIPFSPSRFQPGEGKSCVSQKFGGLAQTYLELGRPICRGVVLWAPSRTGGRGAPRTLRWWRRRMSSPAGARPPIWRRRWRSRWLGGGVSRGAAE